MATTQKRVALFSCKECGRRFFTVKSAERAVWSGCPQCGGGDIDIAPTPQTAAAVAFYNRAAEAITQAGRY